MLKKRIIFTLLYCDGFFVQSRNFDIQKVGDLNWLIKKYGIENISYFIDELIIIDISRTTKNKTKFLSILKKISKFFHTNYCWWRNKGILRCLKFVK